MTRLLSVAITAIFIFSGYQICTGATRTWKGTVSTNWATAGNWSPAGIPQDGDDLVFDPSGINTGIQNVPFLRLNSLVIQSTGTAVAYSITPASSATLSFSGTGNCFSIGNNCTLTTPANLGFDMGVWGAASAMTVNGNFNMNGNLVFEWTAGQLSIGSSGSMNVNGNLTYNSPNGLLNVDGTLWISSGLTIPYSAAQIVVGSSGSMTVHGAFLYQASGNITVNGTLSLNDSFTDAYTSSQLIIGPAGSLIVSGSFLYESSGNITVNGNLITNTTEVTWTQSQITVGNNGLFAINGPFTYHSSSDFVVNGNGSFHINNTYSSNISHTINGNGSVKADAGKTMTLYSDLIINGDLNVAGTLVVPKTRTLRVNGVLRLNPS